MLAFYQGNQGWDGLQKKKKSSMCSEFCFRQPKEAK